MLKLALAMPVLNHPQETLECVDRFRETADNWKDIEVLIIDNGSETPATEWGWPMGEQNVRIIRNEHNIGVLPAQQQIYENTAADIIYYTHNDVEMYEQGWDTKIISYFERMPNTGVLGFFGAKGLGTSDLYRSPYQMSQLIRIETVCSSSRMPSVHGHRPLNNADYEVVTMHDGYALVINRRFLDENGGFDRNLPVHHMYDAHTCLQALDLGYKNIVIPMEAWHRGGMTDVQENWAQPLGLDKAQVHRDAHYPYFYNYWKPVSEQAQHSKNINLPYRV